MGFGTGRVVCGMSGQRCDQADRTCRDVAEIPSQRRQSAAGAWKAVCALRAMGQSAKLPGSQLVSGAQPSCPLGARAAKPENRAVRARPGSLWQRAGACVAPARGSRRRYERIAAERNKLRATATIDGAFPAQGASGAHMVSAKATLLLRFAG